MLASFTHRYMNFRAEAKNTWQKGLTSGVASDTIILVRKSGGT